MVSKITTQFDTLYGYRPYFTTTQPFAYRDTLNMLTWIQALCDNLNIVVEKTNEIGEGLNKVQPDVDKKIADLIDQTNNALSELEKELRALVETSYETGVARSPVRGVVQSVQTILDDMYDNVRVHALFARDYDDMALSVGEWESVGMDARTYDLWPIDIPDAQLGDVADARDHFPRERPIGPPSPEDGEGYYLSKNEAKNTYMPLNPEAKLFGNDNQ